MLWKKQRLQHPDARKQFQNCVHIFSIDHLSIQSKTCHGKDLSTDICLGLTPFANFLRLLRHFTWHATATIIPLVNPRVTSRIFHSLKTKCPAHQPYWLTSWERATGTSFGSLLLHRVPISTNLSSSWMKFHRSFMWVLYLTVGSSWTWRFPEHFHSPLHECTDSYVHVVAVMIPAFSASAQGFWVFLLWILSQCWNFVSG